MQHGYIRIKSYSFHYYDIIYQITSLRFISNDCTMYLNIHLLNVIYIYLYTYNVYIVQFRVNHANNVCKIGNEMRMVLHKSGRHRYFANFVTVAYMIFLILYNQHSNKYIIITYYENEYVCAYHNYV